MILEFEILLVAGAWAFYIYDSSMLLFVDELVLEVAGRRVRVRSGLETLVAGRRPCIPNPLTPHRPLIRVTVGDLSGAEKTRPAADLTHYLNALAPFRVLSLIMLLMFGAALPLVLYRFGSGTPLLCWLVMIYLLVGYAVYLAWRRRLVLGLSPRALGLLAFELFACPPFAVNIVRKLALRHPVSGPLQLKMFCGGKEFRLLRASISRHINRTLGQFDLGEAEAFKLTEYHHKFAEGCDP